LANFGNFLKVIKNHEIEDGGSKMVTLLEPDVAISYPELTGFLVSGRAPVETLG